MFRVLSSHRLLPLPALFAAAAATAGFAPSALATTYPARVLDTPDLLSYWQLNETAGPLAADAAGPLHASFANQAGLGLGGAPGILPASLGLSTAHTSATAAGAHPFAGTTPFTLEAWVKPVTPQSSSRFIVDRQTWTPTRGGYSFGVTTSGSSAYAFCERRGPSGTWTLRAVQPLAVGTWSQLACSFDGTTLSLYVNGRLDSSRAAGTIPDSSSVPLRIGGRTIDGAYQFNGTVDDVAVYGRALSEAELVDHYRAGQRIREALEGSANRTTHYRLDAPGVAQADAGPAAVNATAPAGATAAPPLADGPASLELDGSGPLLSAARHVRAPMTIELWFRASERQDAWLWHGADDLGADSSGSHNETGVRITPGGQLQLSPANLGPVAELGGYEPGRIHHLAVTVSGTMWRAFLDGEQRWAQNLPATTFASYLDTTAFGGLIGGGSAGAFRGQLDEIVTSNRALTPGQIADHAALARDVRAPQTTITSGPADGSTTTQTTATFDASADEALLGTPAFRCAVDGGSPEPCTLPLELDALTPGPHSISIAAQDASGNWDPAGATRSWTVSAPPAPDSEPGPTPSPEREPSAPAAVTIAEQRPLPSGVATPLIEQPQGSLLPAAVRLGGSRASSLKVPSKVGRGGTVRFKLNRRAKLLVRVWYDTAAAEGRSGTQLVRAARTVVTGQPGTNRIAVSKILRPGLPNGAYLVSVRLVERRAARTIKYSAPLYATTEIARGR